MKYLCRFMVLLAVPFFSIETLAGAWTLPEGRLWIKTSLFYQSTDRRFCTAQDALSPAFQEVGCSAAGHSAPFDPFVGGKSEGLAVLAELTYGASGWIDLGIQIPFYSLKFTNLADPDRPGTHTFGDIRFFGKIRFVRQPLVASLEIGAKSPTGKFTPDAEAVNVSEGQWDMEVIGQIGKSFWPAPLYLNLDVGYRIRSDNPDFEYTFSNEFIVRFEGGYHLSEKFLLKGTVDWLRGEQPTLKSTADELLWRRELLTVAPTLLFTPLQPLQFEAAVRFPFTGQDFPDGPQFIWAVSYAFSLSGE